MSNNDPTLDALKRLATQKGALLDAFQQIDRLKERADSHYLRIAQMEEAIRDLTPPPTPAPVEGEVEDLAALIRQISLAWEPDACLLGNMTAKQFARAATLLQAQAAELASWRSRAALVPVPVGERLPGAADCDAKGRCWWFGPLKGEDPATHSYWALLDYPCSNDAHWLPHWAIAAPHGGEVEG